jgi:uncharacterized protein YndB with AHSA1/START domain
MTATLQRGDGRDTLRFERRLAHDPERVWRAVTDPAELREWFPSEVIYEPRVGAPMQFDFGGAHGIDAWPGEVLEWEPPRVFAFAWGSDVLRFELSPADSGTLLVFTHAFAHEPGKPARDAAGWEACLEALLRVLAQTPGDPDVDAWSRHAERYAERFGALAVEDAGHRHRVLLQGPYTEVDGRPAVAVRIDERPAVMVVREAGRALADGVAVDVRAGTVDAPGDVIASGALHDPLASGTPAAS